MRPLLRLPLLILLGLTVPWLVAEAQIVAVEQLPTLTPQQCKAAASRALSRPAEKKPFDQLRSCPVEAGLISPVLMKRYALARDTATYHRILEFATDYNHLEGVVDTAFVIAGNPKSPLIARIWSLVILIRNHFDYFDIDGRWFVAATGYERNCVPFLSAHGPWPAAPWSSARKARSDSLTKTILASNAPPGLKNLAECLEFLEEPPWGLEIPPTKP